MDHQRGYHTGRTGCSLSTNEDAGLTFGDQVKQHLSPGLGSSGLKPRFHGVAS